MSDLNAMGNLSRPGVRPLRSTARAAAPAQVFSVEELKNGGTMTVGAGSPAAAAGPEGQSDERSLRERYAGGRSVRSSRRSINSQLPVEEQIKKLETMRKSAVEYEAFFVDHLVKQMRQSPLADMAGGETFSDIAEQPFREHLSQAGGLGLADTIVGQLARQEGLEQTLQEYPEIMGPKWRPSIPAELKKSKGSLEMLPPDKALSLKGKPQEAPLEAPAASPQASAAAEPEPEKSSAVGLMSGEEIAWLYEQASLAMS